MPVYGRKHELKEMCNVMFEDHKSQESWWSYCCCLWARTHIHFFTLTCFYLSLSVCLIILLLIIRFSHSSITGILSSSRGNMRLVGNKVKMLCPPSALLWAHTHTQREVHSVKRRFREIWVPFLSSTFLSMRHGTWDCVNVLVWVCMCADACKLTGSESPDIC